MYKLWFYFYKTVENTNLIYTCEKIDQRLSELLRNRLSKKTRELFEIKEMSLIVVVVVMQVCKFVKPHQNVYLKLVCFVILVILYNIYSTILYNVLHIIKVDFKKKTSYLATNRILFLQIHHCWTHSSFSELVMM